jgi:uncharacterized protein (DUF1778 family)
MSTTEQPRKDARLDLRLSRNLKRLLQKAAVISGLDLSSFTLSAALEKADGVLSRHSTRILTDRDRERFLEIMEEEEPNAVLLSEVKRYKALQNE